MKKLTLILILMIVLAWDAFAGVVFVPAEGEKIALVIGNNNYKELPKLSGAGTDAVSIAEKLAQMDFEIDLLVNASVSAINHAIDNFVSKLRAAPNCQGFFWYSGQGIQIDHARYLTGIDTNPEAEQIRTGLVPLGRLFEALGAAKNNMNVVIIDACFSPLDEKETPMSFETALLEQLPGNIAYICSASPGETASDTSPFIKPVLDNLNSPAAMVNTFSVIARQTKTASEDRQNPVYWLPARFRMR